MHQPTSQLAMRRWTFGRDWALRLILAAAALLGESSARADIVFYDIFKNTAYTQSSNSQPTTPIEFFGSVGVTATNNSDLTGGNVTSSSPLSPMTLTGSNGNFAFQSPGFSSKSTLDMDFPNGTTYTYNVTGGTFNGQSATLATPASDEYASTVPFFTGNTFNALQGVDPSTAINLTFNTYSTPSGVNTPLTFIGITQVSDGKLAFSTSGDNTLSSALVSPGTLLPNTKYDLDIVFSARNLTKNAGFTDATSFTAYDLRTDLIFTTGAAAVPEPSTITMIGIVLALGMGSIVIKRRASAQQNASGITRETV
jgi:hypothetical protein